MPVVRATLVLALVSGLVLGPAIAEPASAATRTRVHPFGLSNSYPRFAPKYALQAQLESKSRACERRRRAVFFWKDEKLGADRTNADGFAALSLGSAARPRRGRYSVEVRKSGDCRPGRASGRYDGEHFFVD
jgi:hypothetical protein